MILVETPTNPLLKIFDLRGLSEIARESKTIFAVDNSMLSPCLQKPLALGADVVVHSATKFLCGHSDVTAGAVITNDAEIQRQIRFHQNAEGAGLAPFESWLLLRGIKTLALRVERQNESARKIAEYLTRRKNVRQVFYPELETHAGFEIHRRQASGGGAVISFTTGNARASQKLVESTKLFDIAVSFGSVGSVISLPCRMSHASIPQSLRDKFAPPADLIRVSIGIEDVDDLCEDLERAFAVAFGQQAQAASALSVKQLKFTQ